MGGQPDREALTRAETLSGGVHLVEALADEWRILCAEAVSDEPFYRPEFIAAYLRAFEPRTKLHILTARSDARLTGLVPLVEETALFCGLPIRRLRTPTGFHSCRFDLLRIRGPGGDSAVKTIWQGIKGVSDWHLLEICYVPESGALNDVVELAAADGFRVVRREWWRSPVLSLAGWDGTPDWWLKATSGNFRSQIRRALRKANERGLHLLRVAEAEPAALQRFYDLEASGWKGTEGTAIRDHRPTRQFYDDIAAAAARFGYLSLYFLDLGGQTISAHLGLSYNNSYYMPKVAYDEQFGQFSPGHLMVNEIYRDCAVRGLSTFEFLGPDDEWKVKWTQQYKAHSLIRVFRNNTMGRVLHTLDTTVKSKVKQAIGWPRRVCNL